MRNSRGFTMIELLVAMAILVILIGIIAFTFTGITGGAKERETKVRMEALKAMLTELEVAGGFKKQPTFVYYGGNAASKYQADPTATAETQIDLWRDGDPSSHNPDEPIKPAQAPGRVDMDALIGASSATVGTDRVSHATVLNTQLAMGFMLRMPNNAQAVGKLSSTALMQAPGKDKSLPATKHGKLTHEVAADRSTALKPAILVDAWNNPIIFVPAAGLVDVKLKDHGTENHIVNSTGKLVEETDFPNYRVPANARPFFASAGPDGNFTTGDDNIYSFQE